jgi:hypothetical protein
MTKDDLIAMLRGVGCEEAIITAMVNAYELGVEWAKDSLIALPVRDEKWVK